MATKNSPKVMPKSERSRFDKANLHFNMPRDIDPVNYMVPFEQHIWNGIVAWTNVTSSRNPLSSMETLRVPVVNQIRPNTIQIWKTELTKNGYGIVITNNYLIVSLSIPLPSFNQNL